MMVYLMRAIESVVVGRPRVRRIKKVFSMGPIT